MVAGVERGVVRNLPGSLRIPRVSIADTAIPTAALRWPNFSVFCVLDFRYRQLFINVKLSAWLCETDEQKGKVIFFQF